jgi:hypothetical protein
VPYRLEPPSGEPSEDWLRGGGKIRRSRLEEGSGTATVKSLKGAEWSTSEARVGEAVTVTATAKGFEGGTPATVQIKEVPVEGGEAAIVDEIETEVSGEEVEAEWTYTHEAVNTGSEEAPAGGGSVQQLPAYRAEVKVKGHPLPSMTGLLTYDDKLEKQLVRRKNGEPFANCTYHLQLPNGEIRTGTTDGEGWLKEEDVPPGPCEVI